MPGFKTSEEARAVLSRLRRATGILPNLWARAAFGYSLSLSGIPEPDSFDSDGTEFQDRTFFGDDREILLALLRQRTGHQPSERELAQLMKAHVERGLRCFSDRYEQLNRRGDALILSLLEEARADGTGEAIMQGDLWEAPSPKKTYKVELELGVEERTGREVTHVLNAPGMAPHVAIMGRNGTGKTRTGLELVLQMSGPAAGNCRHLIFDYAKGDIASNSKFTEQAGSSVVRLPEERIPCAPLMLLEHSDHAVQIAARRFRDTVNSVVHLGPVQRDRCLKIMHQAYDTTDGTPDLEDVAEVANAEYERNGWNHDSLLSTINEFSSFPLFAPSSEADRHQLLRQSHVIDVHHLPEDLRKLAVFLVLDWLHTHVMSSPDAPVDDENNRLLRLVVVIDEAHHYLPCKQPTLENIVREVRSKGLSIMLLSQSPDDFDQPQYNFAREMGLAVVYACMIGSAKMLEALLGGKLTATEVNQLPSGVALTRTSEHKQPTRVRIWDAG